MIKTTIDCKEGENHWSSSRHVTEYSYSQHVYEYVGNYDWTQISR